MTTRKRSDDETSEAFTQTIEQESADHTKHPGFAVLRQERKAVVLCPFCDVRRTVTEVTTDEGVKVRVK